MTSLKPFLPDLQDVHVYGGGILIAIGAAAIYWPAALICFGGVLMYLGLRRRR